MYQIYLPDLSAWGVVCGSLDEALAICEAFCVLFQMSYWVIDVTTGEIVALYA